MFERFTDRARRVVVLAQEEARLLNHNHIGSEHLLLGVVHESMIVGTSNAIAETLESFGISLDELRTKIEEIVGRGEEGSPSGHIPFTEQAKKVFELALRKSMQSGDNYIGSSHLLLALADARIDGVTSQVFQSFGVDDSKLLEQIQYQRMLIDTPEIRKLITIQDEIRDVITKLRKGIDAEAVGKLNDIHGDLAIIAKKIKEAAGNVPQTSYGRNVEPINPSPVTSVEIAENLEGVLIELDGVIDRLAKNENRATLAGFISTLGGEIALSARDARRIDDRAVAPETPGRTVNLHKG